MLDVVELAPFTRRVYSFLTDDELAALSMHLALNPTAGDLIVGTGGWRKVRWAPTGRGKSGGVRVITYFHAPHRVFLGVIYAKSETDTIADATKASLKKIAESLP